MHSTGHERETAPRQADPWAGDWVGRAELRRADGARLEFEMELRIPSARGKGGEPRPGTVVYRLSGYESARALPLEESPLPDVRWSWVEVDGWLQTTRCRRSPEAPDTMEVEVVAASTTGAGRPVRTIQRATLRRAGG